MPAPTSSPREALAQLESRHDELIRRLDELNAQIEEALAEFSVKRETSQASGEATTSRKAA